MTRKTTEAQIAYAGSPALVPTTVEDRKLRQAAALADLADAAILAADEALGSGDDKMVRAVAALLSTALDKWLLLSGQATSRKETKTFLALPPAELRERALALKDELEQRRRERGGSVRSGFSPVDARRLALDVEKTAGEEEAG